MILEYYLNPHKLNKSPSMFILLGFVYSSIAMTLSYIVFRQYSSLLMVFLTVLALAPMVYASIKHEEHEDVVLSKESSILREHAKTLKKFMYIFLGLVLSFSLWYIVLPEGSVTTLYSSQSSTIEMINNPDWHDSAGLTANVVADRFPIFLSILFNNLAVLISSVVFSVLFGFGAIFILSWNASVIGAAIGETIREGLTYASTQAGVAKHFMYFNVIGYGLLRFSLHGIPEILAYFVGGLAGGILFFAVLKHDYRSRKFNKILYDVFDLSTIAVLLLVAASFIEVFITPVLF
ncbi:MAG: stage II sporulation protein M [Candidatus Woesearchaeota archaeon]